MTSPLLLCFLIIVLAYCHKCSLFLYRTRLMVEPLPLLKTCPVFLTATLLMLLVLLHSKCMIVWRCIRKVVSLLHSRGQYLKNNSMKRLFICLALGFACLVFQACNVTRTVTTEAATYQRGDTTVHITTRTIETYDATKKNY